MCDPQNPNQSDCILATIAHMGRTYQGPNIPPALANLVLFLHTLKLSDSQKVNIKLSDLSSLSTALAGKFPTESRLVDLESRLKDSETGARATLVQLDSADAAKDKTSLSDSLELAVEKEKALADASAAVRYAATSGKDCRAATMLVQ